MSTCELCNMRPELAEILEALDKLYVSAPKEISDHLQAAHNHIETADWLLEDHEMECTVPKYYGPDTVRESEL